MIREYKENDLSAVNDIGQLIKDNFADLYKINDFVGYDYAKIFVYEIDDIVAGFIQIEHHYEIVDIINIAVKKIYQNKGIASSLIKYIVENYECEKIMLEVKEDNTNAIIAYEKNGFKEISRRKKYYGDKDAIIMERIVL